MGLGRQFGREWAAAGAALVAAAIMLFMPQVLNDGDTYWHLAAGTWMLDHGAVPHADPFSYSMPGTPWVAHEWLSEVLMALAYRAGGWSGLTALYAAAFGMAAWGFVRRLSRSIGGMTLLLVPVLALGCMAGGLLARPHVLVLPVLVAWTCAMLSAREAARAPRLWWALAMCLWANLHGSYVFGFLLAGAFGLEALIAADCVAARVRVVRDWGLFGVVCLVAVLATPHGVGGLIYPFQIMGMTILPEIAEWRPADFSQFSGFELALFVTLFVGFGRGVRIAPVRLLLLLVLLYMALHHERHQLVLAVVAPLILAQPFAVALGQAPPVGRMPWRGPVVAAVVSVLALMGARLALPITRGDGLNTPMTALASVPPAVAAQPVLNGYGFGGYLIFKGVKPFIDGRADMYGDAFSAAYFDAARPDAAKLAALLEKYRVAWTIFPADDPVVAVMDADPAWVRTHADAVAVVHQRRPLRVLQP